MPDPLIAVVHDDPTILLVLRELLADAGYRTQLWERAEGALVQLSLLQPDLVILDVHLEQPQSGWLLFNQLRQAPATALIPVLVCTADGQFVHDKATELRELGGDLMSLPFDIDDLLAKVAAGLGRGAVGLRDAVDGAPPV